MSKSASRYFLYYLASNLLLYLVPGFIWAQDTASTDTVNELLQQAQYQYNIGNYEKAINTWAALAESVNQRDDKTFIETQLKVALSYSQLGLYDDGLEVIHRVENQVLTSGGSDLVVRWFNVKGNIEAAFGNVDKSLYDLERAISVATQVGATQALPYLYNDYGNAQYIGRLFTEARESYVKALSLSQDDNSPLELKILVNLARLDAEQNSFGEASSYLIQAANSVDKIESDFVSIQLALSMTDVANHIRQQAESSELFQLSYVWLQHALPKAHVLNNKRLLSSVYGSLAGLYLQSEQYNEANQLLGTALENAQLAQARDLIYLWQWQRAKVLKQKSNIAEALVSYESAVATLSEIRFQLSKGYFSDSTFFESKIKALYMEYVDLLFYQAKMQRNSDQRRYLLNTARATIEELKSAELEDYFQDRCSVEEERQQVELEKVVANAAILYPVLLPDRLELLLSLNGNMYQYTVDVSEDTFIQNAKQFQTLVQNKQHFRFRPYSERLSKWLISPLVTELESGNVETLVIVPDTAMLGLPFSALHDDSGYLIEKLSIAVTPSLTLTAPEHVDLTHEKVLVAAITESVRGYSPLSNAENEVLKVRQLLSAQLLQNRTYTSKSLYDALQKNEYSIVHLATHGAFGTSPEDSYLATFDGELSFNDLRDFIQVSRFRKRPVELLTLSACETASGSNRAALGLAGIAVKSGARSALASLWLVDDAATADLMVEFYQNLVQADVSKASALRVAQVKLLKQASTSHPAYWAPFVLIGNWL